MKKIAILGGSGYVGSKLIPFLLKKDIKIINYDTYWFGENLNNHKNLSSIQVDIRDKEKLNFKGCDAIIHLANIANDPTSTILPQLTWEVNVLSTMHILEQALKYDVKKIIYASSGSVYGVKKEKNITEDLALNPISDYNKSKMVSERVLISYADKINISILRPATICGLSNRNRFDLTVNLLTIDAIKKNKMTIFGGSQIRPNLHIDDMVRAYEFFLINNLTGIWNIGFENTSILDIAKIIKLKTSIDYIIEDIIDERSYRQDSTKLVNIGFKPKKNFENAIDEIVDSFNNGLITISDNNYNMNIMKKLANEKKI